MEMEMEGGGELGVPPRMAKAAPPTAIHGHPALLHWTPPRAHSFSGAQLEALAAICDTIVPSLRVDDEGVGANHVERMRMRGVAAADVERFFELSPSGEDVIDVIAAALGVLMRPPALQTLLSVMGLLSTGWGTFLLGAVGGANTLTLRYPFIPKFASLSPRVQEKVVQGWSRSAFPRIRLLFKGLKGITNWAFYSKLNEHGENAAWKAIGYAGVAPEVRTRTEADYNKQRPLEDGHVDAGEGVAELKALLARKGFAVSDGEVAAFRSQGDAGANDVCVQCDVVVVGSGSGGGVVAAALAKQGFKVLVLEKGGYFAAQDVTTLEGPGMVNLFEGMGCLATDDGGVALIAGKTVGGGTAVNWCVSFKTPDHVRSEWAQDHGLELFGSVRYDVATQAVWERLAVQPAVDKHGLQNAVLQEGCTKLGYEHGTLQRNCASDHYCGWCSFGCPTAKKQSTAETWLVDAVKSGNAVILSNCTAERVLHGDNPGGSKRRRAHGLVATVGGGPRRIFVKATATVVACGALMTPVLLLRSGFRNPNVGKHLRLHPASSTNGYFPEGTGPDGKAYEGGIMTAFSPVALRKPSAYGAMLETGVFHPAIFAAFDAWRSGADGKVRLLRHGRISHITVVTRDKGFGTVSLDKQRNPIYSYSISKHDEESLVAGMVQSLRVLMAAGAVEVGTQQLDGERFRVEGASTAEVEAYLDRVRRRGAKESAIQMASAHQLGSCRMGTSPASSAVDPNGETWEAEGLFVGDGSVLPTACGVNPMVTIQAIAYCTAESVVQYLKQGAFEA